jgi:hypothetical protein
MRVSRIALTLLTILLLAGTAAAALAAPPAPSGFVIQPQQSHDKCRDAEGNEICINYNAEDGRVNPFDATATIAAWCKPDRSLDVWGVINYVGFQLFVATEAQMATALNTAIKGGQPVVVNEVRGFQLVALPTGELLLNDNATEMRYQFRFSPALCEINLAAGAAQPFATQGTAVPAVSNAAAGATGGLPPVSGNTVGATVGSLIRTRGEVNVRTRPDLRGKRLGRFLPNTPVMLVGRSADGNWLKVAYRDARVNFQGWIWAGYTTISVADLQALPVVS